MLVLERILQVITSNLIPYFIRKHETQEIKCLVQGHTVICVPLPIIRIPQPGYFPYTLLYIRETQYL